MRSALYVVLATAICCGVAAAEPGAADKSAIQQSIDAYVAAFNKADSKALASLWTEQGELVNPDGKRAQGRQELETQFTEYFAGTKDAKLELSNIAIELQSPSVALETGIARVLVAGQEPAETEYKAIHIKTAAGWRIDSVRESEPLAAAPSHFEKLQELAWMIGQWTDADGKGLVKSSCRWTSNRNFLVLTFKVFVDDRVDFEGTQIIGWDPHAQAIRSWTFDSDGGFGVGRWSGGDGKWTVQTLHTLPDGRRGSASNTYEVLDDKTVRYRSIGRQVDGSLMPSIGPVTIVRSPAE